MKAFSRLHAGVKASTRTQLCLAMKLIPLIKLHFFAHLTLLSVVSTSYLLKKRMSPKELNQFEQGDGAQPWYSTAADPKLACSPGPKIDAQ